MTQTNVTIETIKELPISGTGARQVLVKAGDQHFVVSSVNAGLFFGFPGGFETLVFPADADGEVTDWGEVAGGRGVGREEAIADLQRRLDTGWAYTPDEDDE